MSKSCGKGVTSNGAQYLGVNVDWIPSEGSGEQSSGIQNDSRTEKRKKEAWKVFHWQERDAK
jgi:hypothetical protein